MTDYVPADDRPLDLEWEETEREGRIWLSEPIASTTEDDDIRLAIRHDDEWVFWAEHWSDEALVEPISGTTYATEESDDMVRALGVIRDTVQESLEA
jgi:hypothetical protein